jgi:dTDP-4-amino-4,6-dideoxygalactose transaminase
MNIPFNKPYLSGNELNYISDAIEKGHISGDGFYTKSCHSWFEKNYETKCALLTHSATAALEMAALLCGFETGDEIIMPSYTFVSTANAFCLRGYIPRFVDVSMEDLNIDISSIEASINERTKAIVVVHYAGFSCDMEAIMKLAQKHSLIVIEDAAQAFGTKHKGRLLGTIGHLGCLSFHETKNVNCGEGGVLFINDEDYIERAEIIREKGTNRKKFYKGLVDKYTWVDIGSSYLPSDLLSAYLLAQLENSVEILNKRKKVYNTYYKLLHKTLTKLNISHPETIKGEEGNGHIFYLIFDEKKQRDEFINHMKSFGIGCVFHYSPLHKSDYYNELTSLRPHCPNTEFITDRIVRLPIWIGIEPHVKYISEVIIEFLNKKISN